MDWEKYWSDKSDGGHTDKTPEGITKEGREKLFHLGSGDRLLDVGCGTGKLLSQYTANFGECIGVERSPTMFAEAQTHLRDTDIALLHGSAGNVWEIVDGDFDVITMSAVAQYLTSSEIAAFVMQSSKRLKSGGRIAIFDIIHSRKAVLRMIGTRPPQGRAFWLRDRDALRCGLRAVGRLALDRQRKDFPSRRAYVLARVFRCHRQRKWDEGRYADVYVLRLSISCGYETRALGNIRRYPTDTKTVHVVSPSVLM